MARILVVDDEIGLRESLKVFLEREGHEAEAAEDGLIAQKRLAEADFDVVLTDIIMPRVNGLELLLHIRQQSPHIQVIILTGEPTVQSATEALRAGAYEYLSKPISRDQICSVVAKAAKIKLLGDENRRYREHLEELVHERTQTLAQSEEKYRRLTESAQDMIWRCGSAGEIQFVNSAAFRLFGYTQAEIPSRDGLSFICEESRQRLHLATEAADLCLPPLENFKIELTYIHKDGSLIPCESNVSILRDETGNVVAYEGITRDMRAWHAAMQRNERLSLLVAHSTNLIAITSQDGTITYLNPAGTRLLGAEPLIGRSIAEFLRFPEGRSFARDILPAVLADGYWQGGHELLPPGEQPPLFIESHIFPIRQPQAEQSGDLAFIMHDLTAHEAAATALKNSLSFLSALIETIPVPVFYKGTDLRYQGCNRLFADFVIGRPRSEFVGKRIDELDIELVPVDLAPIYQNADQELIATAGLQEYEAPVRCADGRRRDFILKKATYHDGAGQVAGILGIMQDITALRQNEEERQRMQEALRQAQKMDALGRLAGGVTHDFNNLLTAINGHVTLALMDTDPSDLRFESLNEIGRASSRASELTTHLMAFARQQQLNKRKVDLNQLIASMKTLFGRLLGEDIELSISPKAGLPAVWADPPQFEQILLNLVLNARDAMPRGGRLLISTDLLLPLAALDAAAPGTPQVVLRVADSGIGMSEEVRKRIFEPFFTTKPPQRASGLGLSTVYGIVAKHGGTIEVASELGQGTAFAISLPAEPEAVPQNDLAFAGLPEGRETILLVEDEKLVLNTALRILNRLGYNVLTAMDSEEAIELLQLRNVPIDLLLTDVILPGKSGVELSSRLKAERPALKILYISGYADDRLRKQGLRRKDIHFLGKPFTPSQLAVKLREVLDATS